MPDDLATMYDRWGRRCRVSIAKAQWVVRLNRLIPLYNQYGQWLSRNERRLRTCGRRASTRPTSLPCHWPGGEPTQASASGVGPLSFSSPSQQSPTQTAVELSRQAMEPGEQRKWPRKKVYPVFEA